MADLVLFEESAFPKAPDDFDEVSRFLEEHARFSFNLEETLTPSWTVILRTLQGDNEIEARYIYLRSLL